MGRYYRDSGFQYSLQMPTAIKWLIIINIGVFLLQNISRAAFGFPLAVIFGLSSVGVLHGMVWQFFTYLFLHGGFFHLLFNMYGLWLFGRDLERTWGTRSFLFFYFFTGVGAGIINVLMTLGSPIPTIGASGAIFGVLVAFAMMFPNRVLLIFPFMFPIRARTLAIIYGVIELWNVVSAHPGSGVATFAHLGGMLFGYVYIKYSDRFHLRFPRVRISLGSTRRKKKEEDWMRFMEEEVDPVLDKISRLGIESLTRKERKILKKARGRRRES
jgi:membrane associated rhomboid family serine protease